MDPEIKRSVSPMSPASPYTVNRFLMDTTKSPYPIYTTFDSIAQRAMPPAPSARFQRSGSPSYTNSSSTCSSSLSPPTDDFYYINSPPTPSDAPRPPHPDSWKLCSQMYQFTGMADACVNLGEINPMQEFQGLYDDPARGFNFPARTCSMSSDESHTSGQQWPEEMCQYPRELSPDDIDVKEEICIPNAMDHLYALGADDIEPPHGSDSPYLKTEPNDDNDVADEDDEYSPYKKSKNGSTKSTRIMKSHKRRSASQSSSDAKRPRPTAEESVVVRPGPRPSIRGAGGQYVCPDCPSKLTFKDQTGLDSHVKKQHTRPFTCIFRFAGCGSTFASKNEWKRHCASQHIVLQYWVCQQDACSQVSNKPNAPKKSSGTGRKRRDCLRYPDAHPSALPNGTIFNRKDLYTQHLRRMHVPSHLKNKVKTKVVVPEWEDQQRVCQEAALRIRCQLPTHMMCPAPNCNVRFDGPTAWDERMEHVAKHLEKAAAGAEPPLRFDGDTDVTLVEWATSPAIGILRREENDGWTLLNPLKATGYPTQSPATAGSKDDEDDGYADAECEDE
ncbi:putative c2h2 finger domain-containing protein [Rosellinia necatrix]|uniref:Putative c2h2 finger domain-containing protein n=1 Tax=Rosellinia necatrix TaxID=77044 RepID=A0A1W2TMK8_ROSNE|nr:putative c2h2 finger domain-containing protein [Rosellinia necatrix]